MSSRTSASRNGEGEDIEASQQLLDAAAIASTGSIEARRRSPATTGTGGVSPTSTPPASPKAASASTARAAAATTGKRRCSRGIACATALVFLALGLVGVGVAVLRSGGGDDHDGHHGYIDYDADFDLPEGDNRASFPVSRDKLPGWMEYHEALKAKAEEDGAAARVVLLGDSITEELLETAVGVARSNWGSIAVWMEYYGYLGGINLGVSGDQTQHVLWRVQNGELPDVLQPESIMVAIGTNNLSAGISAQDTVTGIQTLVKFVREQRPDALVVVMALFPRADPEYFDLPYPWPVIDETNGLLEDMLEQSFDTAKVRYVDCTDRFLAQEGTQQVLDSSKILPDNLHLTKDGLDAWADCAEAPIRSGLRET